MRFVELYFFRVPSLITGQSCSISPKIWTEFCCILYLVPSDGADSWFAPSQWETSLQSNTVSHWLGKNLESALFRDSCDLSTHIQDYFPGIGVIVWFVLNNIMFPNFLWFILKVAPLLRRNPKRWVSRCEHNWRVALYSPWYRWVSTLTMELCPSTDWLGNSAYSQGGSGQLVPRTTRTQDNSYPRQLVPRTTCTQDNS